MKSQKTPVFYDYSGMRWRWAKLLFPLTILAVMIMAFYFIPPAFEPVVPPSYPRNVSVNVGQEKTPSSLAYSLDREALPVIGEGPLVRMVKPVPYSGANWAADVYSGQLSRRLEQAELEQINNYGYAIERYGTAGGRHLFITFDDGPDPEYTPKILDILSREGAQSSFFVVGANVVKHPEIARRLVGEGHSIGNHTFTHVDFDFILPGRSRQELIQAQRVIRKVTERNTSYFRLPYGGGDDDSLRDSLRGILEAQRFGYTVVSYDFDSTDWELRPDRGSFVLPEFDGKDITVLLHDGGGDRSRTLEYLQQLISKAKENNYRLVSLDQIHAAGGTLQPVITPSQADNVSLIISKTVLVWPHKIITYLFVIAICFVSLSGIYLILAASQLRRVGKKTYDATYSPKVSVLVPAYNEEKVISKTIESLLNSTYKKLEIIIVDDGSSDYTLSIARSFKKHGRLKVIHQENSGKPEALNNALKHARGEIFVTIDADTVLQKNSVGKLVRHFDDEQVGAVAGMVKVGNIRNMLSRWQALEYIVGIHLERTAHARMNSIIIVPGACAAWRRSAVLEAGGYSTDTIAEDCDLSLEIRRLGYRIRQDTSAVAYTEAPLSWKAFAKQRYRWTFGNLQSFCKHRNMIFRPKFGWLGLFVLPRELFNMVLQLLFTPILIAVGAAALMTGDFETILMYFLIFNFVQAVIAVFAILQAREKYRLLWALPLYGLLYIPIRTYIIYRAFVFALKGAFVEWNKLARTNTVSYQPVRMVSKQEIT